MNQRRRLDSPQNEVVFTHQLIDLGCDLTTAATIAQMLTTSPPPWSYDQQNALKWAMIQMIRQSQLVASQGRGSGR